MSEWKKVIIGDICKIVKGTTGIASAEPGEYPLVVTAEERKTCSTYQFDCEAVCIPLVSSSGHGKKSLKNVHYQSGKFALGTILCAVIPNNPQELDARYLHQYLQFYKDIILVPLMKGAVNVSLSMKDILVVEFPLPPIERQRELSNLFVSLQEKQKELSAEYEKQTEYAKLLRQNILQQAIEGKLTAEWRKQNPVQKGNPDYDAEVLFEQIQKERNNEKKQKKLSPITNEEKPFEIPESWKWVRLGEISLLITDGKHGDSVNQNNSGYFFLSAKDIQNGELIYTNARQITEKDFHETHRRTNLEPGDICIVNTGATVGKLAIAPDNPKTYKTTFQKSVAVVKLVKNLVSNIYIKFFLLFDVPKLMATSWGSAINNLLLSDMKKEPIPLPPFAEQKEIVIQVEKHLKTVAELEKQITEREQLSKQLMQSILKDAFEEN